MNKTLCKILLGLCLTAQLVLGQILKPVNRNNGPPPPPPSFPCDERLVCQSNNDPHMVNFWNEPFEYQELATDKCLHTTGDVQVSASFEQCPSPYLNAKCNCGVKIKLLNGGEEAFINNCGNTPIITDTLWLSSGPSNVTCQTVTNALFDPMDESDWLLLPVTTGNAFFSCVIVDGNTYIKTKLYWPFNNVIVRVFPQMSSLYVYASRFYSAFPTNNNECLCEINSGNDLVKYHQNIVEEMPKEIERCKDKLLNKCFNSLLVFDNLMTTKRTQEFDKLLANCALDIKLAKDDEKLEVGLFQQNEIQNQINTAILEAFANPSNEKIIREYCACQSNIDPKHVEICKRLNIKF